MVKNESSEALILIQKIPVELEIREKKKKDWRTETKKNVKVPKGLRNFSDEYTSD